MQPTREDTRLPDSDPTGIDEVAELVTTLLATPAERLTACAGWTAHELVAHLCAGAAEEADLIEAHVAGGPSRPTRSHQSRELPFRALPDAELRDRLIVHAARLGGALEQLAPTDEVLFTGRPMTALDFAMHSRSECTLHRWDLVGRDDVGWAMLGQPALTEHALKVLTSMSVLPEAPANRLREHSEPGTVRIVIRSAPHDDVVVTQTGGVVGMTLEPIDGTSPDVELEPAARLLLLWGRREPSAPVDLHAGIENRRVLEALFAW